MSILYLVATPIGNLEDITFRAVRILKEAPLIAAEDTRTTTTLLKHYQIKTPLTSYHDHNKEKAAADLLEHLKRGDLALVSDAGTPAISDPGLYLVKKALADGHQVIPIPGPSAPIAALSASGQPTDRFLFLGYLPRKKKARTDFLGKIHELPYTLVILESPHRLEAALKDIISVLGERQISVARELTKLHEEIFRGSVHEALEYYKNNPLKGEITLVLAGNTEAKSWERNQLIPIIKERLKSGDISPSNLAKELAKKTDWSRRDIYDLIQGFLGGEE